MNFPIDFDTQTDTLNGDHSKEIRAFKSSCVLDGWTKQQVVVEMSLTIDEMNEVSSRSVSGRDGTE